ncbi:MAG: hypothetical protein ACKO11_09550 [Cuspidothrix sp.]
MIDILIYKRLVLCNLLAAAPPYPSPFTFYFNKRSLLNNTQLIALPLTLEL